MVNTLQYDSFGKLISQSNASKQPYHGFAGRDIEPVGGLTYNRNRYYSTQTGRFISQDPIGFNAGDENLYRYVGNSPTNATDPSGLWEKPKGGGTGLLERPKREIPQSVVNIQTAAASATASVSAIKSKPPIGVPPGAVGFAIGYMTAKAESDFRREVEAAEQRAAVANYVAKQLTTGVEIGEITSNQADSLARAYQNGNPGQLRGAVHFWVDYRLATEVNNGNLSVYSQNVLSSQLTGPWLLPSEEQVERAIEKASKLDATKAQAVALTEIEQNKGKVIGLAKEPNYGKLPAGALLYWQWNSAQLTNWDATLESEFPDALRQALQRSEIIVMHLGLVDVARIDEAKELGAVVSRKKRLVTEWELSQIIDGGYLSKTWFITEDGKYKRGNDCLGINLGNK